MPYILKGHRLAIFWVNFQSHSSSTVGFLELIRNEIMKSMICNFSFFKTLPYLRTFLIPSIVEMCSCRIMCMDTHADFHVYSNS